MRNIVERLFGKLLSTSKSATRSPSGASDEDRTIVPSTSAGPESMKSGATITSRSSAAPSSN